MEVCKEEYSMKVDLDKYREIDENMSEKANEKVDQIAEWKKEKFGK